MADALDTIFKAYDVRGIYPDEIDESVAKKIGNAFARFTARLDGHRGPRHAPVVGPAQPRRSSRARPSPAPTWSTSASPRPTSCTSPPGCSTRRPRCSPRATTRPSTTASRCAGRRRRRWARRPGSSRSRRRSPRAWSSGPRRPGRVETRDLLAGVRQPRPVVRRPVGAPAAAGGRRHRQRHGRPHRAGGVRGSARSTVEVLFAELDGTFPNHPADPIQPENLVSLQKAVLDAGADVGLAFDGDADRVFLVDDQAQPISGSITTAIVAKTILEKTGPGETVVYNLICSKAVPEVILEMGGTPDPVPGRALVHQAGDGRDRRGVRWRALGALLLPRQLARRLRDHRRADGARAAQPHRGAAVRAAQAVRALRAVGRDQHDGLGPARR